MELSSITDAKKTEVTKDSKHTKHRILYICLDSHLVTFYMFTTGALLLRRLVTAWLRGGAGGGRGGATVYCGPEL